MCPPASSVAHPSLHITRVPHVCRHICTNTHYTCIAQSATRPPAGHFPFYTCYVYRVRSVVPARKGGVLGRGWVFSPGVRPEKQGFWAGGGRFPRGPARKAGVLGRRWTFHLRWALTSVHANDMTLRFRAFRTQFLTGSGSFPVAKHT